MLMVAAAALGFGAEARRVKFTSDWLFQRGEAVGAEQVAFNDAAWRKLGLPHDWAIEGPFSEQENPQTGALPIAGVGWYRKHFRLGPSAGRQYAVEFDGVMANARVWLNGHEIGHRPYGYIGFNVELTPFLKVDGTDNVLAVRVAPEARASRWYTGAGIYRSVWLESTGAVHVARWGTYVTTKVGADGAAAVDVRCEVRNHLGAAEKIQVRQTVLDADGRSVATQTEAAVVAGGATQKVTSRLTVEKARLWDVEHPVLYTLVSEVLRGGKVADRYETTFGVRTLEFDKVRGFLLNGRVVKLNGVCNHHDLGALGAAVNRRATERQLEILRSMGANAIRTSHNPPSPELLETCDRMGFLVMDEAFDVWTGKKVDNDYHKYFAEWSERDLRDMVRRDRNHPSVVLWSIGNEIAEQRSAKGAEIAGRLAGWVREEDATRAITAGFDHPLDAIKNGLADKVDVPGFNYKEFLYEQVLKDHPDWLLVGSETASTVSSRGVYHWPLDWYVKHDSKQISSYDYISPDWAYLPDAEFAAQERFPRVIGEFVWTGFDYLGEPTPFWDVLDKKANDWPVRSSYFGIIDLAGFPKDRFYLYQSRWASKPMVHVLPHWNWAGREGAKVPVMVYTNAEEAEVFLNGKSQGRKKAGAEPVALTAQKTVAPSGTFQTKYRLLWEVAYEPGTLNVVAYSGGKPVATDERKTAGTPARVRLVADRAAIEGDGEDLSFITVRIEDKDGNLCPLADNQVKFKVDGAARIAAVDNGNAATFEPFQADTRKAFNGLALVIVRGAGKGEAKVTATAEGLEAGSVALKLL
jgi:beta-galactosidase